MTVKDVIVGLLAAVGVGFSLSGAVGIVRMPDVYTRIQCSSKAVTMGALPLLAALAVAEGPLTPYGGRALIVAVLFFVFSPLASHALGRAAYKSGVPMWDGSVIDQPRQENRTGEQRPGATEGS
jgi:multicomponent Na+:H+ antiporter subunit G